MFSNDNINFIIYLFFSKNEDLNGGLIALHKLAYEIANRGYKVFIFTEPIYKHKNIVTFKSSHEIHDGVFKFYWEQFNFPYNNTVTIYPEIIKHNPINTKHVIRWILHKPQNEVEKTFSNSDYVFNYSSHFSENFKSNFELTTLETNSHVFYDFGKTNRNGYCYISGKKEPKDYLNIVKQYNAEILNGWEKKGSFEFLNKKFNEYKYFITYDDKTYLTILAAFSGLIPIVLPQDNRQPLEFRLENPMQSLGVAYGLDDIEWVIKTRHLVKENIKQFERYSNKTINNFIEFIKKSVYER